MNYFRLFCLCGLALITEGSGRSVSAQSAPRDRARSLGIIVGVIPPGPLNAITDVSGVRVGHSTVQRGDSIHTGVTAIIPAPGDLYRNPVPAWIYVGNGYGKLIGETQVREFGEIETPILLTCTLCVWSVAQGLVDYLLSMPGESQHTINPVVGETNDSRVNDMWAHPVGLSQVREALDSATDGSVEEGSVGAGTGTRAFFWKGGIGTSSRVLPASLGGYTVGILVQTNFGGMLTINGAPVGHDLGQYDFKDQLEDNGNPAGGRDGGSVMVVLATDAPLDSRNLDRLSRRVMMGLGRTGSYAANSSGDYVIAFSTAKEVRRVRSSQHPVRQEILMNPSMSPLFAATVEATQEAVYNALFMATTISGRGRTLQELPIEETLKILRKYHAVH